MSNLMSTLFSASGPVWQQALHAAYVLSGVLMAAGYIGQIRRAWRTPQASLVAQSMPSWLLWTLCRAVALAYVVCVVGDSALILAVGLDVTGRAGVLLTLLRARRLLSAAARTAKQPLEKSLPQRVANARRRDARQALVGTLLLSALAVSAQTSLQTSLQTLPRTTAMNVGTLAQQAAHADARELLRHHRHAEAFGRFAELADQGHVQSAHLALALYDHGPALLGQTWSATPGQQRRWFALVQPLKRTRSFLPDTEARE